MSKLKNLAIVFDGEQPFRTGQMLTGRVCFHLKGTRGTSIHYLNLFFLGVCKVKWNVGSDDNKRTYKSKEIYFAENMELLQGGRQFPAGNHQLQFRFRIPNDIPSSLSAGNGSVTYSVSCNAKCFNPGRKSTQLNFTIWNPLSIHLHSTAAELANRRSLVQEQQKGYSRLGFNSYKIDFDLTIMKSAYEPGDRVIIDGHVLNRSSYEIEGLTITLLQEITYLGTRNGKLRGKRKQKTCRNKLSKWKGKTIKPRQKEAFLGVPTIRIPAVPETGCRFCSNIKISYFLSFSVSSSEAFPTKIRCSLRDIFICSKTPDPLRTCISHVDNDPPEMTQTSQLFSDILHGTTPEDVEPPPPSYESVMANYFPPHQVFDETPFAGEDHQMQALESAIPGDTQF